MDVLMSHARDSPRADNDDYGGRLTSAALAQLGERQTEDLKVSGSIPEGGIFFSPFLLSSFSFLV